MSESKAVIQMKLEFAVKTIFREELPCETPEHNAGTSRHFGPGRFYVKVLHGCPESGRQAGEIALYCQGFTEFIANAHPGMYHRCFHCKKVMKTAESFTIIGPIGTARVK